MLLAELEQLEFHEIVMHGVPARCAALMGVQPEALVEALVQRYPEGATIGWHRDAPSFGLVVGVSLGSRARLRFRRGSKGHWTTWELETARHARMLTWTPELTDLQDP